MEKTDATVAQSLPIVGDAVTPDPNVDTHEPTAEELKQAVIATTAELEKGKAEISRLQGLTKKQVSKTDIAAIQQEIAGVQDWMAEALDKMANPQGGEGEFEKPKTSYAEQLTAKRKAASPENQPLDADGQAFFGYMLSQGLKVNDDIVQEALASDRTPAEAFTYLKGKIDTKAEADITKRIETGSANSVQATLVKLGLITGGVNTPSGGGATLFTAKGIADMDMETYQKNLPAIRIAQAEGTIKP